MSVRRAAGLLLALACLAVVVAGTAHARPADETAVAAKSGPIVLGGPWGRYQQGYGKAHPSSIVNGGDPTGVVSDITWKRWGSATATGTGTGDFVWPGYSVASGSTSAKATVVAWGRTTCNGRRVYRHLYWYFPAYGQKLHRDLAYDLCDKKDVYPPYHPAPETHCDNVTFPSGTIATDVTGYRLDCAAAHRIVTRSGADGHADGGRFRSGAYFCGTDGRQLLDGGGVQVSCELDQASVSFKLN